MELKLRINPKENSNIYTTAVWSYWRHLLYTADLESLKFKAQGYGGDLKLGQQK